MRIAVAMSGGVDSSVAAMLLADEGHEVVGVTMKIWDDSRCCSIDDAGDARRVAARLGIPHFTLDAREAFEERVIAPFLAACRQGLTPSPCVLCNRKVKFSWLAQRARMLGCQALATGHYARIEPGADGLPRLLQGLDASKDQSYFVVPQSLEDLAFLRFPLGGRSKLEIRELAQERGLPVAHKPDSQDLCFLPPGGLLPFLAQHLEEEPGEVVDLSGKVLGRHRGLATVTLGQRKGLGIASAQPLHVVRKDPKANRVVLGPRDALQNRAFRVSGLVWLEPGAAQGELAVKTRSTGALTPCRVRYEGGTARVELAAPQFAVTPGQLAVFYAGRLVAGAGWIEEVLGEGEQAG